MLIVNSSASARTILSFKNLAYKFMGIYYKYILELDVVNHDLHVVQIDYNKLHMVRPYITIDNMDIWIPKMISLSRSDLRKEIKEERPGLLLF